MINKKTLRKDKRAVSPVIGVILMVAITVILAAVIGAFVFGMGGSMQKTYLVGATASQSGTELISVTYTGGPDDDRITMLSYRGIQATGGAIVWEDTQHGISAGSTWSAGAGNYTLTNPEVGDTIVSTTGGTGGTGDRDHILVGATFEDGSTQLILDTYV